MEIKEKFISKNSIIPISIFMIFMSFVISFIIFGKKDNNLDNQTTSGLFSLNVMSYYIYFYFAVAVVIIILFLIYLNKKK